MEHKPIYPEIRPENVALPKGQTLSSWLNSRIARHETRELDWDALKFQADFDPKYRRAQMRYIGTGGTGVATDDNAVPAEHFTFSTMVLPAGGESPLPLPTRAGGGVFLVPRHKPPLLTSDQEGNVLNQPQGARPVLGAARRLSRAGERGHRGSADVRDHRQQQAGDADLSAGSSGCQDQALEKWRRGIGLHMNSADKDAVEERLTTGILGQWYAVGKSVQVKRDKPHAVKALGRNLVLWRDTSGKLHCLEDYCPHRGARLSGGEVNADNISCRYHGVTLNGAGTIVRVPAMPGCALEGRKAVDSYAVIETNDGIFVYFPSKERPQPCELKLPAEFSDPAWSSILCMGRWECSYRFVYDNFADPMHACYLHADSFTLAYGAKQDVMKVEQRNDGFYIARVQQQDVNLDWTDVVLDGAQVYCRLDIPYPDAAGPGGP